MSAACRPSARSSATCSPPGQPAWPPCATSPPARPPRLSRACPTPTRPRSRSPRGPIPRCSTGSSRRRFRPSSGARAGTWRRCACRSSATRAARNGAFDRLGVPGYLMCHLSHSSPAGACLYFTFALNPPADRDALEDYGVVKRAIQQAFVDSGATLSHHHAVGTEHAQWLEEDISTPGVAMLRALFEGTDPGANLNPGKIVAADSVS